MPVEKKLLTLQQLLHLGQLTFYAGMFRLQFEQDDNCHVERSEDSFQLKCLFNFEKIVDDLPQCL